MCILYNVHTSLYIVIYTLHSNKAESSVFCFGKKLSRIASASSLSLIIGETNFFMSSGSRSFFSQRYRIASIYVSFRSFTVFSTSTVNLDLVKKFSSIVIFYPSLRETEQQVILLVPT